MTYPLHNVANPKALSGSSFSPFITFGDYFRSHELGHVIGSNKHREPRCREEAKKKGHYPLTPVVNTLRFPQENRQMNE